ncbi:MAG: M48 family metalloprotease [Bacteroidetes bacterium]|nr:M48 family metalloprotease [Bacteroidota bacterium]
MRLILFLICLLGFTGFSSAQISVQSSGNIPTEIFSSTTNKYALKRKETLDSSYYEPREVRLARLRFYEESYYLVDAIKNNANIYINDSYTKLINDIADELLKDDPELRNKLYLYAYRAPYVNAFSTDQGDMFFTMGLMAYVHNEAELAFVIGHEIIHYLKQHNTANFSERVKIARGEGKYQGMNIDRGIEEVHSFSRELEKEADVLSLDYFLKSDYDPNAVISALNMLKTAHLGYAERPFNYNYLLGERIKLSGDLLPQEIPQMKQDSTDDKLSTHPNLSSRIEYCTEIIHKSSGTGNKQFIHISESDFKELQKQARQEQLLLFYNDDYYAHVIYNASLMYEDYPEIRDWLQVVMNKSFRAALRVRNATAKSAEYKDKNYTGELFRVYHLLYKLNKYETSTLYFLKEYYAHLSHPDEVSREELETALMDMIRISKSKWKRFEEGEFDTAQVKSQSLDALMPLLKEIFYSAEYRAEFENTNVYYKRVKDESEEEIEIAATEIDLSTIEKPLIDRVIVLNPYYLRLDEKKEGYIDHRATYENELKLLNAIDDATAANNMNVVMLDVRRLQQNEGEKFDDIAVLNDYVNRFAQNEQDRFGKVIPASDERLDSIREKYGTDYVMWVGVQSYKGTNSRSKTALLLNLLVPSFLPYSLISVFEKDHQVTIFYVMFDLKNHKIAGGDYVTLEYMKDNQSLISLYLNSFIRELNRKQG